jgi:hypothetical protein
MNFSRKISWKNVGNASRTGGKAVSGHSCSQPRTLGKAPCSVSHAVQSGQLISVSNHQCLCAASQSNPRAAAALFPQALPAFRHWTTTSLSKNPTAMQTSTIRKQVRHSACAVQQLLQSCGSEQVNCGSHQQYYGVRRKGCNACQPSALF